MFRYIRTVLNNLNKIKYLRNINNVRIEEIIVDDTGNNPITTDGDISKIKYLEEEIRHNNLQVFYKYYLKARAKRFFIVTLPAMISAITIGSFVLPTYYDTNKDLKMYKVTTTTLSNNLGENQNEEKYYYAAFDKKIIDNPDMKNLSNDTDEIHFRISDGANSVVADIDIYDDNTLHVTNADQEDVLDLSRYEDLEYDDIDSKYATLFDDIISILSKSGYLSKDEKAELDRLSKLDKVEIIAEIVDKEYIGKENVKVNASIIGWRIVLLIVLVIYGFVEGLCLSGGGYNDNKNIKVGRNGKLEEDDPYNDSTFGLMYGPMKYREIFMKAEVERLKAIEEEAYKNIEPTDIDKIFTSFEKKLLKKY